MKTYAAITGMGKDKRQVFNDTEYPHMLVSYLYDKSGSVFDNFSFPINTMVDSGAHSAWSKGATIDLDAYIAWALRLSERYPSMRVTNLDVIPGKRGDAFPSEKARKVAADQSVENAETIRAAGLRVIEVMHYADPPETFLGILERRRPGEAIGIGGLSEMVKSRQNGGIAMFGDAVFNQIRDFHGPNVVPPVHGFGVSVAAVLYRYPLASIDASSWVAPQQWGQKVERGRLVSTRKDLNHLMHASEVNIWEMKRVLEAWSRRERDLTAYWRSNGVVIEEEGAARVAC